jgi:hypothetical protein
LKKTLIASRGTIAVRAVQASGEIDRAAAAASARACAAPQLRLADVPVVVHSPRVMSTDAHGG